MQCLPLYSVLKALDLTTVDYLSLDVEGAEYPILKAFPFDKFDVKLLEIESNHMGHVFPGSISFLDRYLERSGFQFHKVVEIDRVYVKTEHVGEMDLSKH